MKDHENLKEGSQPISRKDEGDNNKRAQEEFPEAPGPVIGMNDEKGPVSTLPSSVIIEMPVANQIHRKDIETW
jgi:hypothetical protein